VVVLAPSLSYVVLGALREGTPLCTLISDLPRYLSDNVILVETAFNLPGFFRQADVGQFLGELGHLPSPEVIQAPILEAAALISVTMLITDLLHARLDPQVRTLR
jgi:ABC-type dipeptide/oligopeptide/nickel transport system permease component